MPVKKGQVYEGVVEGIDFPNQGKVMADGQQVTVKNALPGQRIRFSIKKARKEKAEGRLLQVTERAPEEQIPACGVFGQCGGCLYLSLPYETQLALKEKQIRKILNRAAAEKFVFEGILPSPAPWEYRNKMEFTFGDACKDGPLSLGMHRRDGFYDIITADRCQIVDEDYRKILQAVLGFFRERHTPHFHRLRHDGFLRHLLVRKGAKSGQILIDLITTSEKETYFPQNEAKAFVDKLLALDLEGTVAGILHTVNDSPADAVRNDGTVILYGKDYFYEEILGLQFRITPFSFFQTNSLGAEVLYEKAREYVGETKDRILFDLYSGTGTIAQLLAPVAKKVVGVEIVEEAVEAARENAARNGLTNCEFLAGDVLKVMEELADKPDLIVLDPPRDGVHPKALRKIMDFGVERMVYISCKPTSLARDLEALQAGGYRLEKAVAVDMFPWAGSIETVVLLRY